MPFKIIQTLENGSPHLCIVPSLWEMEGKLRWPPKKINVAKFIQDENYLPSAGWRVLNCVLKRKDIATYNQAEKELAAMEEKSDTDANEPNINESINVLIDYDTLAENLVTCTSNEPVPTADPTIYEVYDNNNLNIVIENQNVISQKLDVFMSMLEKQSKITEKIANKLALVSVQLQDIHEKLEETNKNEQNRNVTMLKDARPEEKESFYFKIIEDQEGLDALETRLCDKVEFNRLKKLLLLLCSSAKGKGVTCSYKLLDTLFSREFFCKCSWSGGSRGEQSKVPLKNYKQLRRLFYDLIHSWDETFTMEDNEIFFKAVLKNANKRKAMRGLRASAKKVRKSKEVNEQNIAHVSTSKDDVCQNAIIRDSANTEETEEEDYLC